MLKARFVFFARSANSPEIIRYLRNNGRPRRPPDKGGPYRGARITEG